jgi:hypothetical protein
MNKFCPLPWIGMNIVPNGIATPCCKYRRGSDADDSVRTNTHTLKEVRDGPFFQQLRDNFTNGVEDPGCRKCWDDEAAGIRSFRENSVHNLTGLFNENPDHVQFVQIGLSNFCNLQCVMCSPHSSHHIADLHNAAWDYKQNLFGVQQSDTAVVKHKIDHWTDEDIGFLKEMRLDQTEAPLSPEFHMLLDRLDAIGGVPPKIHISTNATYVPSRKVAGRLRKVLASLQLSIDALGAQNEYLRYGSVFSEIEENLTSFWLPMARDLKLDKVIVRITLSNFNLLHVDETVSHFAALGEQHGVRVLPLFGLAVDPPYLNPANLPDSIKQEVAARVADPFVESVLNRPSRESDRAVELFVEYARFLDAKRGTSFAETFPGIHEIVSRHLA